MSKNIARLMQIILIIRKPLTTAYGGFSRFRFVFCSPCTTFATRKIGCGSEKQILKTSFSLCFSLTLHYLCRNIAVRHFVAEECN